MTTLTADTSYTAATSVFITRTLFSLQVTVIHAITPVVRSKVGMMGLLAT